MVISSLISEFSPIQCRYIHIWICNFKPKLSLTAFQFNSIQFISVAGSQPMEKMYNIEWLKTIKRKRETKIHAVTDASLKHNVTMEHGTNQQIVTIAKRTFNCTQWFNLNPPVTIIKDCARGVILLKLTDTKHFAISLQQQRYLFYLYSLWCLLFCVFLCFTVLRVGYTYVLRPFC